MKSKTEIMVMGDEAVAWGAVDAGIKGAFAYPGTPSTEVYETAEHLIGKLSDGRVAQIGANEKVAYEFALGASYAGFRSIVTMKHVGLNVAMDAFVSSGMTGVNGGLVVLVADDPGMHSSQNEQDSRYLADFAFIPCLEPETPQQAYDYTIRAFELSEQVKRPVLLKLVTRLAHARGPVKTGPRREPVSLGVPEREEGTKSWVLIPANARGRYQRLRDERPQIEAAMEEFNTFTDKGSKIAIVTGGMGGAYFDQVARDHQELRQYTRYAVNGYPFDQARLKKICDSCEEVYVFEENYPFIEDQLVMLTRKATIHGRRDNALPIAGELNLTKIKKALGIEVSVTQKSTMEVPPRPPKLCDGCGHVDAFKAISAACNNIGQSDFRVFGDIGCYTLGTLPPFNAVHACVEMGASVGMTMGAALTGMDRPAIGVIGDSTFFHSGLPTLITLAKSQANATFVIMDNRITAMTGQQQTVAHNAFEQIALAAGLKEEEVHVMNPIPKNHEENTKQMEKILKHKGPDVVIFRRDCIQALRKGLYKKYDIK